MSGGWRSVLHYLGLWEPPVDEGFVRQRQSPRLPVCTTCGAVVADGSQVLHARWHARR